MTAEGTSTGSAHRPRVLVVVHEPHAGLGRLGEAGMLRGADVDELRPDLGDDLPADLDGVDALVVLGGSMAAWDDEAAPWLPATRRLLAEGVQRAVPTLGICLGAQLLAVATGGRVARGAAGLEVGLVEIELTEAAATDPLLGPVEERLSTRLTVAHWHQDAIVELPAGAVPLATAPRYPHQAFRLGAAAWGLQYHPEVSAEDWRDWVAGGHGSLHTEGLDPAALTRSVLEHDDELTALAQQHAAAFARLVAVPFEAGLRDGRRSHSG